MSKKKRQTRLLPRITDLPVVNPARRSDFLAAKRELKLRRGSAGRAKRVIQVASATKIQNNFRIKYNGWRLQRILEEQEEAEKREQEHVQLQRRAEFLKKEKEAWTAELKKLPESPIRTLLLQVERNASYNVRLDNGWNNNFDHILGAMNFYPTVDVLNLRRCWLSSSRSLGVFCKTLRMQSLLVELRLRSCKLDSSQLRGILSALRRSGAQLKVIDLTNNRLIRGERKGMDMNGHRMFENNKAGMEELGLCLKRFDALTTLTLHKSQVGGTGMEAMIANRAFFNKRTRLRELDISHNCIGIKGAQALAHVITGCPGLSTINLAGNQLKNVGLDYILLSLIRHPSFVCVDLSRNHITDSGVERIVELVKHTPLVKGLDLQRNKISAKGIAKLSEAILFHDSITDLDLSHNYLTSEVQDDDIIKAQTLISSSKSMKRFGFRHMNIVSKNFMNETTNIHAAARAALAHLKILLDAVCTSRCLEVADFRDPKIRSFHEAHRLVQSALRRHRAVKLSQSKQRAIASVVLAHFGSIKQDSAAKIFLTICIFATKHREILI